MPTQENGIATIESNYSFDTTVNRLEETFALTGVTLFATVDHSGEAAKVGMQMPPTKLLIFGNPRAGTPVMLAAPSSAIDLPLKILVWQDHRGGVYLSWNDGAYLAQRHSVDEKFLPVLSAAAVLAARASGTA